MHMTSVVVPPGLVHVPLTVNTVIEVAGAPVAPLTAVPLAA